MRKVKVIFGKKKIVKNQSLRRNEIIFFARWDQRPTWVDESNQSGKSIIFYKEIREEVIKEVKR